MVKVAGGSKFQRTSFNDAKAFPAFLLALFLLMSNAANAQSFARHTTQNNSAQNGSGSASQIPARNPKAQPAANAVRLLDWVRAHVAEPVDPTHTDIPRYDRKSQFGTWAHQDTNHSCLNTRAEVLERDADPSVPVGYKSSSNCVVETGLWHEPYTGEEIETASELQIDHVVPLRNAYYAGAHAWRTARRCHYANFLANDFHLLAVSGHENMSKGDKGPDGYLPPAVAFQCQYVSDWMKIKTIWELTSTQDEVDAIAEVVSAQHCDDKLLVIAASDLTEQRAQSEQPITECERFEQDGISALQHGPQEATLHVPTLH